MTETSPSSWLHKMWTIIHRPLDSIKCLELCISNEFLYGFYQNHPCKCVHVKHLSTLRIFDCSIRKNMIKKLNKPKASSPSKLRVPKSLIWQLKGALMLTCCWFQAKRKVTKWNFWNDFQMKEKVSLQFKMYAFTTVGL